MDIKGVEIFSVGKWNGDDYTREDLHEMVRAFVEQPSFKPFIKLGHDKDQKVAKELMEIEDGLPALGWINRLYVSGEKLLADFIDIPGKLGKLIKKGAYKKISSEVFWNIKIKDKTYKRMLAAVALLGADTPGVMNLGDILAMYKKIYSDDLEKVTTKEENFNPDINPQKEKEIPMEKTEGQLKAEFALEKAQAELKSAEDKLKNASDADKAKDAEIVDLKKFKVEAEAKLKVEADKAAKAAASEAKAKRETFVNTLVNDKLCTPAMKPYIAELLGEEKKVYSIKVKAKGGEDEEKELTKEDLIKETLKLFKSGKDVNFDDNSSKGKENDSKQEAEQKLDERAKKYAKANEVSYNSALKIVRRQKEE